MWKTMIRPEPIAKYQGMVLFFTTSFSINSHAPRMLNNSIPVNGCEIDKIKMLNKAAFHFFLKPLKWKEEKGNDRMLHK